MQIHYKIQKDNLPFTLFVSTAFLVGTFLRLYMIQNQILLDDEWHQIAIAISHSFFYLLSHTDVFATSPPMNLYSWLLFKTVGLSELLIRLPALCAGILCLAVFPLSVKKNFNWRVSVIFSFLFAISPFMIFHARFSRPYGISMFLAFVSVMALYQWIHTGKRKHSYIYMVCGLLSSYSNLTALAAFIPPLGFIFLMKIVQQLTGITGKSLQIVPSLRSIIFVCILLAILLILFVLPPYLEFIKTLVEVSHGDFRRPFDRLTFQSMINFSHMLSGNSNNVITTIFMSLSGVGLLILLRFKPLFAIVFIVISVSNLSALYISQPAGLISPLVFSRYTIIIFPFVYILTALGINAVLEPLARLPYIQKYSGAITVGMIFIFCLMLFIFGPLPAMFSGPNNFTNHSAFNNSAVHHNWEHSYKYEPFPGIIIKKEEISSFYTWLSNDQNAYTIIEYPMMIANRTNLLYYYQHFHKKNVIAGYITRSDLMHYQNNDPSLKYNRAIFIEDGICIDHVLSEANDFKKMKFTNIIDMLNMEAIINSKADFIVLHKNVWLVPFNFFLCEKYKPIMAATYLPVLYLEQEYKKLFGQPVFTDADIIVFRISS